MMEISGVLFNYTQSIMNKLSNKRSKKKSLKATCAPVLCSSAVVRCSLHVTRGLVVSYMY